MGLVAGDRVDPRIFGALHEGRIQVDYFHSSGASRTAVFKTTAVQTRSGMGATLSAALSTFSSAHLSHIGLVRTGNEDSALISPTLIAVADGMGGHAGGEVASSIAISALASLANNFSDLDSESREDLLLNVIFDIDDQLVTISQERPELSGMGTTLTALALDSEKNQVQLLHVGDSRCYSWDAKKKALTQLSIDHTVMQELLQQGRLTPEEIIDHPQRSLLTQALVGDSGIDPVLQVFPAKAGQHFLLCSDGLSSVLTDLEMAKIISAAKGGDVVGALLDATLAAGAPDNVTIIWAKIDEGAASQGTALIGAADESGGDHE